jgi:hypothetical protein
MLKSGNPNARYCYKKALAARECALETKNSQDRIPNFAAEARWLKLAWSYEFSAWVSQFLASQSIPPQRPSCPACGVAMPLVEVQAFRGGIEYAYECEECGRKMNITLSDD